MIIGLISSFDKLHDISKKIFEKIISNEIKNVYIPSSVFLEYELLLKSKKINVSELVRDIIHFKALENVKEIPLDSSIIILAQKLKEKYKLTYFDSFNT
ncbi:MAG: PIN domain-containing protein [Candidatus Lokiarchaeota archaeon]|nr:PIN domain-containing protein [Candidatus Lokiarchaeota archaeon]